MSPYFTYLGVVVKMIISRKISRNRDRWEKLTNSQPMQFFAYNASIGC
jgi:hypothetical protein